METREEVKELAKELLHKRHKYPWYMATKIMKDSCIKDAQEIIDIGYARPSKPVETNGLVPLTKSDIKNIISVCECNLEGHCGDDCGCENTGLVIDENELAKFGTPPQAKALTEQNLHDIWFKELKNPGMGAHVGEFIKLIIVKLSTPTPKG